MLGRQQIASIPTAISELFKNAYDAYAEEVRADYFPHERVLYIRDDGVGMSERDFHQRWLTIATGSKSESFASGPPPRPTNKVLRPIMGEKGIGRLAVASIGPQLLLVTRAREATASEAPTQTVVALIQWSVFEIPGLTLDDVTIPLITLPPDAPIDGTVVNELFTEALDSFTALSRRATPDMQERILAELAELENFDPTPFMRLPGPSLSARHSHGTHFFILPISEDLPASLGAARDDRTGASPFLRLMIGFTNTMLPGTPAPELKAHFFTHDASGETRDLIDSSDFWTPEDFLTVDHDIEGHFDEYGQFRGSVSIYGKPAVEHVVPWSGARGSHSRCGPFKIRLGYVQGASSESGLSGEDFALMSRKLNRIGGLYVFRDGIRILPYGSSDVDYLNIEVRRTKNIGRYYFSYRRMFGCVDITGRENFALQEKAGREGFRENAAYRDFRGILENFFIQLAADFFKKGGSHADEFEQRRAELKRIEDARLAREKKSRSQRQSFAQALGNALDGIESGRMADEISTVLRSWRSSAADTMSYTNGSNQVRALIEAERAARDALDAIRRRYIVTRPKGIGLGAQLSRDFGAYQVALNRVNEREFLPAVAAISQELEAAGRTLGVLPTIQSQARLQIEEHRESVRRRVDAASREVRSAHSASSDRVAAFIRECLSQFDSTSRELAAELERVDLGRLQEDDLHALRARLASQIEHASQHQLARLRSLRDALTELATFKEITAEDEVEALEEQVLALQEQAESELELIQLGTAVQIISHEFEASIRGVRRGLQRLRPWARSNNQLMGVFTEISTSFQHLDGYLTLFTPLQRRLYRQKVAITGDDVSRFLNDLFHERLQRHGIRISTSTAFREFQFLGFPSTYYPVFVNLIDNALFWLGGSKSEGGVISLDSKGSAMLVRDNGPGIPSRDREVIFESGFSRKPSGRGLGLRISRALLAREGWTLDLTDPQPSVGAEFRVAPTGASALRPGINSQLEVIHLAE